MDLIKLNIPAAIFDNQFISLHLQLLKEDLDTRTDIFEEVFLNVSPNHEVLVGSCRLTF